MNIGYYAPSYKRPQKSITQRRYPFVKIVVKESEVQEYINNGNDVIACPDSAQGNIARVRNWILDNLLQKHDAVVIIDDDSSGIGYWSKQKYIIMDSDDFQEFFEAMYYLTIEWGYLHFGLNCVTDKGEIGRASCRERV